MPIPESTNNEIHIIGAGGLARDFVVCFRDEIKIAGYWDDGVERGISILGIPVLGSINDFKNQTPSLPFVIMVANPSVRKIFSDKLVSSHHFSPIIVHSLARIFDIANTNIGEGCVIFPASMLTTAISIGKHTLIHTNCSIHHDSTIGSNCVMLPGSRLTGNVDVGDNVLIGANVALTNGMKIANGEKIG